MPAYTISPEEIFQGKILLFNVNFFGDVKEIITKEIDKTDEDGNIVTDSQGNPIKEVQYYYYLDENGNEVKTSKQNMASELQGLVSSWYVGLRNIALIAMLSILVYIGIRISISSIASDKAKYKQMLQDWLIGILLIFFMHYIMSFSNFIVEKITTVVASTVDEKGYFSLIPISNDSGKADKFKEFIEKANMTNLYVDANLQETTNKDEAAAILYPSNLLGYIRIKAELENFGEQYIGNSICFLVLVLMTVYFIFTYLKRVLYMAFLTIIAPLVAVTYPIDKMNDGSAQGFEKWLKEYIFNLLIQPLHLLLYYILVTSAWNLSSSNILYSIVALGFMIPAEKLLRNLFGFEKAQTAGALSGAAGAAVAMGAINSLKNLGSGGKGKKIRKGEGKTDSNNNEDSRTPRMKGDIDENAMFDNDTDDEKNNLQYNKDLTQDQMEELKADGLQPGDQEYNQYLMQHGINSNAGREENSTNENVSTYGVDNINNGSTGNSSSSRLQAKTSNHIRPKRNIGKKIRRSLHPKHGTYKYRLASGAAKLTSKAIRFGGKAALATGLGTIGLATGIVSGNPSQAFSNALAAGGVGIAVGGKVFDKAGDGFEELSNKATLRRMEIKEGRKYEDIVRDDYIRKKEKEFKKTLKANFDKEKVEEMYNDGTIDKYIQNGVDDVNDIVTAEKMREADKSIDLNKSIYIAKSAKRVGSDYNTPKAKEWTEMLENEYQHKLGVNTVSANKAARKTMDYVTKFNKTKKTNYK